MLGNVHTAMATRRRRAAKVCLVALAPVLVGLGMLPARAQIAVDMAKITCRQYLLDKNFSPKSAAIANWLSGYFNGLRQNTVVDIGTMAKNKDTVEDYCRLNLDTTLMDAAKNALGLNK